MAGMAMPCRPRRNEQHHIVVGQAEHQLKHAQQEDGGAHDQAGRERFQQDAVEHRGKAQRQHHQGGEENGLKRAESKLVLEDRLDRLGGIQRAEGDDRAEIDLGQGAVGERSEQDGQGPVSSVGRRKPLPGNGGRTTDAGPDPASPHERPPWSADEPPGQGKTPERRAGG